MNALLVRVGADLSNGGGRWNGPVDIGTCRFVYAPIPEGQLIHPGFEQPYTALEPMLARLSAQLPDGLRSRNMHLDPDFDYLTYGDQGERGRQLRAALDAGDLIVFYAALRDVGGGLPLVYAIIGLFVVERLSLAAAVDPSQRQINAHTRRVIGAGATDVIVHGRPGVSGRLARCIPIGEYRDRAYRVQRAVLEAWGGLSVKDGYLQRSARLPRFLDPLRFLDWFHLHRPELLQVNNV